MELTGKKIAFLGDSITQGHGTSSPDRVFWRVLGARTGAECFGYGVGGTRIAIQQKTDGNYKDRYFSSRIEEMIDDPDVVVVFGGTNDFGHGDAPFGTQLDRSENTFCGAVHILIQKLINRYPQAQIVFMTPLHRIGEEEVERNEYGLPRSGRLRDYVDAIKVAAEHYGIPVLDLYRVSGIQPEIPILRELYTPDGLHPNDRGNERIADRLEGFLKIL